LKQRAPRMTGWSPTFLSQRPLITPGSEINACSMLTRMVQGHGTSGIISLLPRIGPEGVPGPTALDANTAWSFAFLWTLTQSLGWVTQFWRFSGTPSPLRTRMTSPYTSRRFACKSAHDKVGVSRARRMIPRKYAAFGFRTLHTHTHTYTHTHTAWYTGRCVPQYASPCRQVSPVAPSRRFFTPRYPQSGGYPARMRPVGSL